MYPGLHVEIAVVDGHGLSPRGIEDVDPGHFGDGKILREESLADLVDHVASGDPQVVLPVLEDESGVNLGLHPLAHRPAQAQPDNVAAKEVLDQVIDGHKSLPPIGRRLRSIAARLHKFEPSHFPI